MTVETKLEQLGLTLPAVPAPVAAYVPGAADGTLVFTSGQLPTENGVLRKGKLGEDMTVEEGYEAARIAALNCLAVVKSLAGSLDRVEGRTAFTAMAQGDPVAKALVDEYASYLGCGVASLVNILQPEVVCIGGGVSNAGEALLAPVDTMKALEAAGDNSARLAFTQEFKAAPFALVWDYYCAQKDAGVGLSWLDQVKAYERDVLLAR